jgi:hypothetical protein
MPLRQQAAFDAARGASGGAGSGFFSAQWSFGHHSIHTEPVPVDAAQLIKLLDARLPA